MTTADNQPLGQALAENQAFLQTMFGGSSDFYTKSFTICGCRCCIAMFAGLSSPEKLCIMVLHALGQGVPGCKAGPQLVQYLAEQSCLPTEQTPITTRTQLVEALAGGMAVLLSALAVYFRDLQYLYGILTMAWMYATPLFYPISALPPFMVPVIKLNPLYHYINCMRCLVMYGTVPGPNTWIACIGSAVVMMGVGLAAFRKLQRNFILYL